MQCHIEPVEMWLRQAQPDNLLFVFLIAQCVKLCFVFLINQLFEH